MGVVEDLARARADFERGDWSAALGRWTRTDAADLAPADRAAAGTAAFLLGRPMEAVDRYERAQAAHLAASDAPGALRCMFHLVMMLAVAGETSRSAGWLATADRQLVGLGDADLVERGYLAFAHMFHHLGRGDPAAAAASAADAAESGRRFGDADLTALGLCGQGRIAIRGGRVTEGLALLDESMSVLLAGGHSPIVFGHVYCTAIEGCQQIAELGRVSEWTVGLQRWCSEHPELVPFTGQCSLHRGQLLTAHGAFRDAVAEFDAAIERYRAVGQRAAIGLVAYERGQALRILGEAEAAADGFRLAREHGFDPQPGLAQLWLGAGERDAAEHAARRLLAEARSPVARVRTLPGAIAVLLACGDTAAARSAVDDLDALARDFGFDTLRAHAASASAAVELAAGDPAGALPYARKARELWSRLDDPYGAALARAAIGSALLALDDEESARTELEGASATLRALCAVPDAVAVERRLAPAAEALPGGLTAREGEVLRLVAAGRSNQQIAAELVISERTVARHLSNLFTKLGVGSRTAAAAYAYEHGLVRAAG